MMLELPEFIFFQRGTGIAIFAAAALALAKVADEFGLHHFVAHQDIVNSYHETEFRAKVG